MLNLASTIDPVHGDDSRERQILYLGKKCRKEYVFVQDSTKYDYFHKH